MKNNNRKTENGQRKAIVHVITGDGKGKTTASLGLALRAIGANKRVKIIQFMKTATFSEHEAIKKFNLPIEVESFGIGFYKILGDNHTEAEHKKSCEDALEAARNTIRSKDYDLIVLDEINVALGFGLLNEKNIIDILNSASNCDIVLTGRKASIKIKKIAQLVSEVKCIKHYFDSGQDARKGIEF
jgi:cob(I)alamin adenosyltransferase